MLTPPPLPASVPLVPPSHSNEAPMTTKKTPATETPAIETPATETPATETPARVVRTIESVSANGARVLVASDGAVCRVVTVSAKGTVRESISQILSETAWGVERDNAAIVAADQAMSAAAAEREGRTMGRRAAREATGGAEARTALMASLAARIALRGAR